MKGFVSLLLGAGPVWAFFLSLLQVGFLGPWCHVIVCMFEMLFMMCFLCSSCLGFQ